MESDTVVNIFQKLSRTGKTLDCGMEKVGVVSETFVPGVLHLDCQS